MAEAILKAGFVCPVAVTAPTQLGATTLVAQVRVLLIPWPVLLIAFFPTVPESGERGMRKGNEANIYIYIYIYIYKRD